MGKSIKYIDEKGHEIEETEEGYLFIDGCCVAEPGTDRDFDRYAVEGQNGDGYYDTAGKFRRYSDRSDAWWWDNI